MPRAEREPFVPQSEWIKLCPLFERPTEHTPKPYAKLFLKTFLKAAAAAILFGIFLEIMFFASMTGSVGGLVKFASMVIASQLKQFLVFNLWFIAPLALPLALTLGLASLFEERSLRRLADTPLPDTHYLIQWSRSENGLRGEVIRWSDRELLGVAEASDYQKALQNARSICWKDAKDRKLFFASEMAIAV